MFHNINLKFAGSFLKIATTEIIRGKELFYKKFLDKNFNFYNCYFIIYYIIKGIFKADLKMINNQSMAYFYCFFYYYPNG